MFFFHNLYFVFSIENLQVIFIPESSTIDFYPSDGVAVLYITEADCILNDGCRQKLAKLRNVGYFRLVFDLKALKKS